MNLKALLKSPEFAKWKNIALVALLGMFMIGMAIAGVIMSLREPLLDVEWAFVIMAFYAYSGVVIILSADRSPRFAVFVAGITFAVMNAIQQLVIITQIGTVPSAILSVIMDIAMVICSILCLTGDRHSSLRLLGISIIHFANVFTAQMLDVLEITDHMFGYTTFWWMIVECLFLVVFMVVLMLPEVREESVKSRIKKGVTVVGSKLVSEPGVSVLSKDVDALTGKDQSGWISVGVGPVESEYNTLVRDGNKDVRLTACRWKGEDVIRIFIAPEIKHRLFGSGFVLRGYSIEDDGDKRYLRMYGDDGFFVRMLIADYIAPVSEEGFEEPVEYLKDKMITG